MKKIVIGIIIVLLVICIILGGIILFKKNRNIEPDNTIIEEQAQNKEVTDEALPEPIIEEGEGLIIKKEYFLPNNNDIVYTCQKVTITQKYNSDEYIYEIPNFNIDSPYSNEINEGILQKYEKIINDINENQFIDLECEGLEYEYYQTDNIVSLYLETSTESYIYYGEVYNINPSTGNQISNKELLDLCEISIDELPNMIQTAMEKEVTLYNKAYNMEESLRESVRTAIQLASFDEINHHNLFINEDGDLSMYIYTINLLGTGGDDGTYVFNLKTGESRNTKYYEEKIAQNLKENTSVFDNSSNTEYTSNLQDDINGKIAILKNGEDQFKTETKNGYYIYIDNFGNTYNIKTITNIESKFEMMSTDNNLALFKAVITYKDNNNVTKQFEVAVVINDDSNMSSYISVPYDNYTGSTSFTKNFVKFYDLEE